MVRCGLVSGRIDRLLQRSSVFTAQAAIILQSSPGSSLPHIIWHDVGPSPDRLR